MALPCLTRAMAERRFWHLPRGMHPMQERRITAGAALHELPQWAGGSKVSTRVGVVADSTACLPADLVRELGIEVVPVDLAFEGRVYRDGLERNHEEFYSLLKKARRLPTTSAPSPSAYLDAFLKAGRGRQGVLGVTVASRVSAMYQSALVAKDMAQQAMPRCQVAVLDSGTAAMAQGFVVLEAARQAKLGKELYEVEAAARDVAARVNIVAMVDTLYYLAKGGRIPRAAAWMGSVLDIKPIIEFRLGEAKLVERSRTRRSALARIQDIVKMRLGGRAAHLAVVHADAAEDARKLGDDLLAVLPCIELYVTQFTPVMGAHLGPGLVGVAFYPDQGT